MRNFVSSFLALIVMLLPACGAVASYTPEIVHAEGRGRIVALVRGELVVFDFDAAGIDPDPGDGQTVLLRCVEINQLSLGPIVFSGLVPTLSEVSCFALPEKKAFGPGTVTVE